jgi:acyl carrier protein
MKPTFDVLRDILVKDYELAPERLAPETPLAEIELDSLALTELIFALEDEFHVVATTNGAGFTTLADVAGYIDQLVAERDAAQRRASS